MRWNIPLFLILWLAVLLLLRFFLRSCSVSLLFLRRFRSQYKYALAAPNDSSRWLVHFSPLLYSDSDSLSVLYFPLDIKSGCQPVRANISSVASSTTTMTTVVQQQRQQQQKQSRNVHWICGRIQIYTILSYTHIFRTDEREEKKKQL